MAITEAHAHRVWPYSEEKLNPYPISNIYCWHPVVLYDAVIRYEGRYDSKSSYFFLKKYNYNYNAIYIYQGYTLYSVEIIFTVSFTINTLFPPMRRTLYAGRAEPSAEASGLYTHALLQVVVVVVRKTASSECILQGAKNMEVVGCQIGNVERMRKKRRAAHIQHTDTI